MSNQSEAASFNTTGKNASLFSCDVLRKFAYFSKDANQASASSDGSPRNTGGANVVSMTTGIAGVAIAGGGVADVLGAVMADRVEIVVANVAVVTTVVVVGVSGGWTCNCDGKRNTVAVSGADDGCVDGDDVNSGATNSSVADPRVDSAGGL